MDSPVPVVKEHVCPAHGDFENETGLCPWGCSVPAEREFRTAPAYHNGKTQRTDRLVRDQLDSMGVSNIRSARAGEASRIQDPRMAKMHEFQKAVRNKYPKMWGEIPDGSVSAALAAHHAPAVNALAESKDMMAAEKRPVEYIQDKRGDIKLDVTKAAA